MNETEFERKFAPLLRQIKSNPRDCPSVEEILADGNEQALQDHLGQCETCRELVRRASEGPSPVDDLSWKKVEKSLASRPSPWKKEAEGTWFLPVPYLRAVAAGVLLVAVGLGIWANWPADTSTMSITRGPSIQMVQPVGQVDRVSHFQWSSLLVADRFRVTVAGLGIPLEMETTASRLALPDNLQRKLIPGHGYRWRVQALDEEGRTILESEWAEFRIGSRF